MPFWWPFGRKRRKSKRRSKLLAAERLTADEKRSLQEKPPSPFHHERTTVATTHTRRFSLEGGDHREKALTSPKQGASPSTTPFRKDSIEDITALPLDRAVERSPHLRPIYEPGSQSPSSSRAKRSATDHGLLRRKSSKKRKDEHLREQEIRAMSPSVPRTRHADPHTGALLKLEGLRSARRLADDSVISLPMAPSVRSSITAMSDNHFEVGSVDLFSARPKIRYSLQSQLASGALIRSANQSRSDSRKGQDVPPRQLLKESKTIDNLADSYDGSTLRELMERDQRRRERKRKAEEDKARKRLERHAAKAEGKASRDRSKPRKRDGGDHRARRDTDGLGLIGLEAGPSKLAVEQRLSSGDVDEPVLYTSEVPRNPFEDHASEVVTPVEEPVIGTAQEIRYSTASLSPSPSPMALALHDASALGLSDRPLSGAPDFVDVGNRKDNRTPLEPAPRKAGPLTSAFRRSMPHRRRSQEAAPETSQTQTSFSNTSRESMSRQLAPAHLRERTSMPRARSGLPTRTMSKFREDLPELPLSPPDSRVQSPDVADVPIMSARRREKLPEGAQVESRTPDLLSSNRNSTGSTAPPSAAQMSQSLASVDSEGSWLSGRPRKRFSGQMSPSAGALEEHPGKFTGSYEDLGMPEDQYFRRLIPAPDASQPRTSGIKAAFASSSNEASQASPGVAQPGEQVKRGNVDRIPTVVHRQARIKSNEGLLRRFKDSDESEGAGDSTPGQKEAYVDEDSSSARDELTSRPGSLEAQHARRISSGSARLLDIPSRRDSQRSSTASPLPPLGPQG
ncbi:MAG: hypothetical protein M1828_001538 [Chrysothrix sp. TS-e1954]|nr:MAG: hypothetical protein M1828_001538 [Chrysothrix sp. TS-e1954]